MNVDMDEDAIVACADLVGRTGATGFEIGYLHDDVPTEQAGWYAHAQFPGTRLVVEDQPGPVEAADALSRRLLRGASCRCGRPVALTDASTGTCRWRRNGNRWQPSCDARPLSRAEAAARRRSLS